MQGWRAPVRPLPRWPITVSRGWVGSVSLAVAEVVGHDIAALDGFAA
ncbi:hypothetical protein I551_4572 [Mycobacterium ulcerans str. Harvey]|uniref:Uncharacterized protein n=1 Tax=Mycobacterium ulcerans str. Harvey TaxID=1299332 RepID=A0ABN0QWC9_MYCUL|nr:hypothetical protein MMSP_3349 [Mycobacterium sp. 012931]EUA88993.1 hypothetical protein I551_4572 [Mycobacterium ulcerans str. Harvey]